MKLYCQNGAVIAWHGDEQVIPAETYGEGVAVIAYTGSLTDLGRIGDAPAEGQPDLRRYRAPEVDLATVKEMLNSEIDRIAEEIRLTLITPGTGQAMEYQEAQAQAAAALKAPTTATAAKYPMLAVTIGIDIDPTTNEPATDVLGVARSIDKARIAWGVAGSMIRGGRLSAKKSIAAAATQGEAEGAFTAGSQALQMALVSRQPDAPPAA